MAVTRVNSASISATSTTAAAYTTTFGVALLVGDLVVVTAASAGTHVTNGISCSDAVNGAYASLAEVQFGSATSRWLQTFAKVVTAATASTTSISVTPYASNTASTFVVDVFRGVSSATPVRGPVTNSGATALSATAPALPAAATAGDLVVGMIESNGGTFTVPSGYTAGSARTGGSPNAAHAYVLSADGVSTYGGTWAISASNPSAEETIEFGQLVAGALPQLRVVRQAVMRGAVI